MIEKKKTRSQVTREIRSLCEQFCPFAEECIDEINALTASEFIKDEEYNRVACRFWRREQMVSTETY